MRMEFLNQPKLSEHEADKTFNERRVALAQEIEGYIQSNDRFKDKDVSVTYAQRGISSLISIVDSGDEKVVLKIPLSTNYAEGEPHFLKTWEAAGVKVPHVHEEGVIGGHSYTLMEYIDAPLLMDAYTEEEWAEKGIFREMGQTLRRMHEPRTHGFGRVVDGGAEFPEFKDWLMGADIDERIAATRAVELLTEEHGSIDTAQEILLAHVGESTESSFCHDDFGTANVFATTPLTVFDPNPRFNNGYIDLGRSMLINISKGVDPAQLVEGYFGGGAYDERALHAAILLATYMKFPYWHKTKKHDPIRYAQEYLRKNRQLVGG